ncbi:hypothetical protein E2C01_027880 [Portunus trituberculatus]|uniref:Uncharacterized protein n=1 Tax=Portunus trituberculatus TaxID=210409 RepID=A0A5B7EMD3_PORTR|nr:hypothetical protein [Portunus trituberculatus]
MWLGWTTCLGRYRVRGAEVWLGTAARHTARLIPDGSPVAAHRPQQPHLDGEVTYERDCASDEITKFSVCIKVTSAPVEGQGRSVPYGYRWVTHLGRGSRGGGRRESGRVTTVKSRPLCSHVSCSPHPPFLSTVPHSRSVPTRDASLSGFSYVSLVTSTPRPSGRHLLRTHRPTHCLPSASPRQSQRGCEPCTDTRE